MSQENEAPPSEVRGYFRLVVDPFFGPFFWGKMLAASGVWIHNVVAAIVAFQVTGSALMVGAVSVIQFAPQLLFAPLSGKLADMRHPKVQIAVGRLLVAAGSAGLACWIWMIGGVDRLTGVGPVLLASLVVGVGFVVGGPAMESIVPSLVRPGEIATAVALNSVPMTVARAGGPPLGVLVATQVSPAAAFVLAGIANALYGLTVLVLRIPRSPNTGGTDFSLGAALGYLRTNPALVRLLVGIAAVGVGVEPAVTLAPPLSAHLGGGESLVGWLASAFGIGAGLGFLIFAPLHTRAALTQLGSIGLLIMACGLVIAALASTPAMALGGYMASGIGMTIAFTSITTEIQERSPNVLRGRIMALWYMGFLGARPFAAVLNGLVADSVSVAAALAVTAGVVSLAAYICRPNRLPDSPIPVPPRAYRHPQIGNSPKES